MEIINMWIAFYNNNGIGDALLLTRGKGGKYAETESNGDVTIIKDEETGEVVSVNIFNQAENLGLDTNGQVKLTDDQVDKINDLISEAGFDVEVEVDNSPKFVVGYVEEAEPLEGSDHLTVTYVDTGDDEVKIVCGASNIAEDLYVIVALPGAVMPDGSIIWEGELRGEPSYGMICSTAELNLQDIEDYDGIWELDEEFEPGTPLEEVVDFYRD